MRIARLEESVSLLKQLLSGDETSFAGEFYGVRGMRLPVPPVQQPHPPLIIGGGSRRTLSLAARQANVVGIMTRALLDGSKEVADLMAAATERKIGWVHEAAGDRFDQIELNTICPTVEITADRRAAAVRIAADLLDSAADLLASPAVLLGTVDEIAETLPERRDRLGFSSIVVLELMMEAFAPVVDRLRGR